MTDDLSNFDFLKETIGFLRRKAERVTKGLLLKPSKLTKNHYERSDRALSPSLW